jgi:hypothetical protein
MLVEGQLIERFGWTFEQLDEQDSGRTFQTVTMMNTAQLYKEVFNAVEKHNLASLTEAHWTVYKLMQKLEVEDESS